MGCVSGAWEELLLAVAESNDCLADSTALGALGIVVEIMGTYQKGQNCHYGDAKP
jgi:hypothetical protein